MKHANHHIVFGSIREMHENGVKKFETPDHKRFLVFKDAVNHRTRVCLDKYFKTHVNKIAGQGAVKYFFKHRAEAIELGVILLDHYKRVDEEVLTTYERALEEKVKELEEAMKALQEKKEETIQDIAKRHRDETWQALEAENRILRQQLERNNHV